MTAQSERDQLLVRTPAEPSDVLREKFGEALFALSDKLRGSNFFDSSDNHAVYERVVAAFTALAATEPKEVK